MRAIVLSIAAALTTTCSSSTATSPTPPPSRWTLTGTVVATGTSIPVPGATVTAGVMTATTDASGAFTLINLSVPPSPMAVTVKAPGYLTRETRIALPKASVTIDLIQDAAPFTLNFYRELARNGSEQPNDLQPLWRWTSAPTFYIVTTDDTGQPVSDAVIATLRDHLPRAFAAWTNNLYTPTVQTGAQDRPDATGQIRVLLQRDKGVLTYCARATVGGPQGRIEFNLDGCPCFSTALPLNAVWHVAGHAAGVFHVTDPAALMHNPPRNYCTSAPYIKTMTEQYHASIIYRRPPMNRDIDVDPDTFALVTTGAAEQPTVTCAK